MTSSTNKFSDQVGPGDGYTEQPMNVGSIERIASIAAGGVGLLLLSRKLFVYVSLALISAYMVYRGVTGRCAFYSRANIDTRGQDELAQDALRSAGAAISGHSDAAESENNEIERWMEQERALDPVEQASWESFPASDPPGAG